MGVVVAIPLLVCHTAVIGGTELPRHTPMTLTITRAIDQLEAVGLTFNEYVDWLRETRQIFSQTSLDRFITD